MSEEYPTVAIVFVLSQMQSATEYTLLRLGSTIECHHHPQPVHLRSCHARSVQKETNRVSK